MKIEINKAVQKHGYNRSGASGDKAGKAIVTAVAYFYGNGLEINIKK